MNEINKAMDLTYTPCGDYLLPDISFEEKEYQPAFYGEQRRKYLMEHRKGLYSELILTNTLADHLKEIDLQAQEMSDRLISGMRAKEGVTEHLKEADQMEWVRRMNNIRSSVKELILNDLIYA